MCELEWTGSTAVWWKRTGARFWSVVDAQPPFSSSLFFLWLEESWKTLERPLKKETSHSCVSDSAEKLNEQESTVRDPNLKAFPIKCFVFHHPVSCDGESVGPAKKKEWTLEGVWVPEKARLLSKKAWLQSQLQNLGQVIHGSLFRPSNV